MTAIDLDRPTCEGEGCEAPVISKIGRWGDEPLCSTCIQALIEGGDANE